MPLPMYRPTLHKVLTAIAEVNTKSITETTLPLLFGLLPSSGPARNAYAEQAQYRNVLGSLATLCTRPSLFEILVIRLSAKLDLVCSPTRQAASGSGGENSDVECDAAYAYAILSTLRDVLQAKVDQKHIDIPKYADTLGEPIFWLFLRGSTVPSVIVPGSVSGSSLAVTSHSRVIGMAAKIITLLVRHLPTE